jgi:hypothetical protein
MTAVLSRPTQVMYVLQSLHAAVLVVQVDVCVNDCMRFEPLTTPQEVRAAANQCCSVCKQRRYEVKRTSSGTRIIPCKAFFWFGLGPTIRDRMFTDPSFCRHRTTGREEYFYCSMEAARLAEKSGCNIWDYIVSCYEVGVDWAQMFSSKVHSTGFIMIRCADMPLSHLNRRRFSHVVGIIPGPSEPSKIDPYLEPLLDDFKKYGPQGKHHSVCMLLGVLVLLVAVVACSITG